MLPNEMWKMAFIKELAFIIKNKYGHFVRFVIDFYNDLHHKCNKIELHCRKINNVGFAPSKDPYQPGHPPLLISLRCPHEESFGPLMTLIRLGGRPR